MDSKAIQGISGEFKGSFRRFLRSFGEKLKIKKTSKYVPRRHGFRNISYSRKRRFQIFQRASGSLELKSSGV